MATNFRRGFKAEAERLALSLRAELKLQLTEQLKCERLAEHLEIPIISVADLRCAGAGAASVARLVRRDSGFSALTIAEGTRKLIVFNPNHPATRRANSVAHEISHVVLEHPAAPALGEGGCRYWHSQLEDEADWQAGAILVPRDGALEWLKGGKTMADGAENFGVSLALFRWRVNHTGIRKQLSAIGIQVK